jgi:predicted transcriptional regulator
MARRRADACYRELGAELRKRRIAANLTMRELAYHLDWSPSTVSRVESGYIGLPTTEVCIADVVIVLLWMLAVVAQGLS